MKERNIILEGKLKSWLLSVDIEKLAAKQQGQLILGLEKLYQATGDADYHTFAKKAVDNLVAEDGTYAKAEGSLSDNLFGNALFAVRAMDTVYNLQDTAAEKTEKAKKTSWFKGLKAEFKKIIWPDKKTLAKQTVAVTVCSVILGAVIAVVDVVVKYGIDFLVK